MSWLLPAVVAVPVLAAGLTILVGRRLWLQRAMATAGVSFVLGAAVVLLVAADSGTAQVVQVGGWAAPAGITLVADRFASIVLTVSAAMLLAVLIYAMAQLQRDALDWWFHTKYLVLNEKDILAKVLS